MKQEEKDIEQIKSICESFGMTLQEFKDHLKRISRVTQKMIEARKVPEDKSGT
jgi:hypothetical protein